MHVAPGSRGRGYVFRMDARASATGAEYPPPPPLVTLLALTMGVFLVTLNVTVVTVALPDIQRSLHARPDELEWVIDAYNLVGASLLLSAGFFADRFGRKRALCAGYTVFTAGAQNTLPLWIFGAIRLGQQLPEVNVVVSTVIVLTVIPVAIAARLTGGGGLTRGGAGRETAAQQAVGVTAE